MRQDERACELVVVEEEQAGERRAVSLIMGESLAIIERTSGPVTEVAYGAHRHGHKMICSYEACAQVLGEERAQLQETLVSLFGREGAPLVLSDLMDRFDALGEHYTYIAWTGEGDVALRVDCA